MDNRVSPLEQLRVARLRPTRQRIVVLQLLHAADDQALSAEDVVRCLLQRGTPVSSGTVYRILHELEHANVVLREWTSNRKSLFRVAPVDAGVPPVSVVCLDTGRHIVLEEPELYRQLADALYRRGVDLRGRALAIQCAGPRQQHALGRACGCAAAARFAAAA